MSAPETALISLDAFRNANRSTIIKCELSAFLDTQPAQAKRDILAALDDPTIQVLAIHRVLTQHGYKASHYSVGRHRLKKCRYCATRKA